MRGNNDCSLRYAGCRANPPAGKASCAACRAIHAERAAEKRELLKACKLCVVCRQPAVKVEGKVLTTCAAHREYFNARVQGG